MLLRLYLLFYFFFDSILDGFRGSSIPAVHSLPPSRLIRHHSDAERDEQEQSTGTIMN